VYSQIVTQLTAYLVLGLGYEVATISRLLNNHRSLSLKKSPITKIVFCKRNLYC